MPPNDSISLPPGLQRHFSDIWGRLEALERRVPNAAPLEVFDYPFSFSGTPVVGQRSPAAKPKFSAMLIEADAVTLTVASGLSVFNIVMYDTQAITSSVIGTLTIPSGQMEGYAVLSSYCVRGRNVVSIVPTTISNGGCGNFCADVTLHIRGSQ